tara:strand:+ start:344 stop:1129 length:786 start_codon:yes stop_codon:yes gene_type:complete
MTTSVAGSSQNVLPYENAEYYEPSKDKIEDFKKLMMSIRDGETVLLNKYIEDNGDVDIRLLWYGGEFCPEITLLMIACQYDHYNIIQTLLSVSANVHAQDEYGRTALHYAANNGSVKNCNILIKNGAIINQSASKICYRLLGPNTSISSGSKETALHEACNRGFIDVVKFLIANGADINTKNKYEETPIEKCESKWFEPSKEELEVKSYLQNYIKKRSISVIIIQNAFRSARYNPDYKMCQKIQKESLENEIRKIYNDLKS